MILVNDQLDAQFFSMCLFQFSTCFEQPRAHHQENQLYQYNIWHMSLCVGDRFLSPACTRNGHRHRVTYTRCCIDTIDSPDDEHEVARNMKRIEINTYLLTPCSRVLLEKLTGSAASQKILRIFGTRRFITVLTMPTTCPYPEPTPSSPHNTLPLPEDPSSYCPPICVWVSPMVSFPQVSPPEPCAPLSPPSYASHAPPISFFSILPPAQYSVRSTDH